MNEDVEEPRVPRVAQILANAAARRAATALLPPDRVPVADLCKPLSATVMPRSGLVTTSGTLLADDAALRRQRGDLRSRVTKPL